MSTYNIREGYRANLNNAYYDDQPDDGIIWQPDVYRHAVEYAKQQGITNIIDIGSGNGEKLYNHRDEINITFIDFGANLDIIKSKFQGSKKKHTYIDQNFEDSFPKLDKKLITNAVVICSDVIEHIRKMEKLTAALVDYSKQARLLLISTPDRERMYGHDHNGHPLNPCHVREWRLEELKGYFKAEGMDFHIGLTRTNDHGNQRATLFIISGRDFLLPKDGIGTSKKEYLHKIVLKPELSTRLKELGLKAPRWEASAIGLLNNLDDDYFLRHYVQAIKGGYSLTINHVKFLNVETQDRFYGGGIENSDRLLMQYLKTTHETKAGAKQYPITFTLVHDANLMSKDPEQRLLTFSMEELKIHYLPEIMLGFDEIVESAETLTRLFNQANIESYLKEKTAQVNNQAWELSELRKRLAIVENELARVYKNPAFYAAKVAKKTARKVKNVRAK